MRQYLTDRLYLLVLKTIASGFIEMFHQDFFIIGLINYRHLILDSDERNIIPLNFFKKNQKINKQEKEGTNHETY